MACVHCTALEQAVRDLIAAVEALAAGNPGYAAQAAEGAKYWVGR
jgi:hypothetical protein